MMVAQEVNQLKFSLIIDSGKEEQVTVTAHARSPLTDRIEALVLADSKPDRIAAYTEDEMRILKFSDIECITVLDGKTCAIDRAGIRYRLKQRLYELEPLLPESFIRINKSSFANENHLQKFTAAFSGAVDAVFKCGYREYVSRRCFAAIKRRYDEL